MNRFIAKGVHEVVNSTFWAENPDWSAGNAVSDVALKAFRLLPFSVHEAQKKMFFSTPDVLAVSGETVVVAHGVDEVDKFMFRYPLGLSLETFRYYAEQEVRAVTSCLAGIALQTTVGIERADIFRFPLSAVDAVTQTQPRLDLALNPPLDLIQVQDESDSPLRDRTARDVELLLEKAQDLFDQHAFYPDIASNSRNVRRNVQDGSLTLIDVMPFYADGTRLIGDKSPSKVPPALRQLKPYEDFIGEFGA